MAGERRENDMNKIKRILIRIFNPGRVPDEEFKRLEVEGILFLAEKVRINVIYKNFKAPGRWYWRKCAGAIGCFVVSGERIMAFTFFRCIIHIPFDSPEFKEVDFKVLKGKYLSVSFDPAVFNPKQSGRIEFRFYLRDITQAAEVLKAKGGLR